MKIKFQQSNSNFQMLVVMFKRLNKIMRISTYLLLLPCIFSCCEQNSVNKFDSNKTETNFNKDIRHFTINKMTLPSTDNPLVLRTDFSDENEWKTICDEIVTPNPAFGFLPHVVFASDITFKNLSEDKLFLDSTSTYNHAFIFIVDKTTMTNPEHPILCLGLKHNQGLKLRTIPSEMWSIENNLSISNMDFIEFSDAVDKDGIFRGFK